MADPILPGSAPAEPPSAEHAPRGPRRRRPRYSISVVLALALALLVIVTVATVVTPLLYLGRNTTVALLRDKGELMLSAMELRVREQMEPAANQLAFIAEVFERNEGAAYDPKRVADILTGALAATPQIASLTFVDSTDISTTALRNDGNVMITAANLGGEVAPNSIENPKRGRWSVRRNPSGELYILRERTVSGRDGHFMGTLYGHISIRQLSNSLGAMPGADGSSFILYDHDYVLAHPRLTGPAPELGEGRVLPRIDEVDDPVLAAIWSKPATLPLLGHGKGLVHAIQYGGDRWLFIYRKVTDYGDAPWLVGTYVRAADALADLRQLMYAGIGAIIALVVATIAAVLLGRWLAHPITQLAAVARYARGLRFSDAPDLPHSPFREIDEQVRAFDEMLAALRWFESYVPRKLVRRLARRGDHGPLPSVERDVTVMFTDIVGFTPLSERMSPVETAQLLNRHFELITTCIEAEDGTVDKFIGDAVMAFWGAPSRQRDHATRAVRAAAAIVLAIEAENVKRRAAGEKPIRVRIGIHTGPTVVGNIGAEGRINYTIVGDTVNAAQRIEQLGRQFLSDQDCVVLFSDATEQRVDRSIARTAVGTFTLRGRAEAVPVFRLVLPAARTEPVRRAAVGSGR